MASPRADDHPEHASRQHDLPPVVRAVRIGHRGDQEREERADRKADDDAGRHGPRARREPADQQADD
jgi:hypothetical protein